MFDSHLAELYEYLNVLSKVQASGHFVNGEIKEVINAIRIELGLEQDKKSKEIESYKYVYEAKIGQELSVVQKSLFDAVLEGKNTVIPYIRNTGASTGAMILEEMFPHVHFLTYRNLSQQVPDNSLVIIDYMGDKNVEVKGQNIQVIKLVGVEC